MYDVCVNICYIYTYTLVHIIGLTRDVLSSKSHIQVRGSIEILIVASGAHIRHTYIMPIYAWFKNSNEWNGKAGTP